MVSCCKFEAIIFVANFASPSLIKADVSNCTLKMMGEMISALGAVACGILLTPVFSYKPGTLYMDEYTLLKQLNNTSCQVDASIQLHFDVKSKTAPCLHNEQRQAQSFYIGFKVKQPA